MTDPELIDRSIDYFPLIFCPFCSFVRNKEKWLIKLGQTNNVTYKHFIFIVSGQFKKKKEIVLNTIDNRLFSDFLKPFEINVTVSKTVSLNNGHLDRTFVLTI